MKMLSIFFRLRVGIPVILMGECGCGKTALLKYLCLWLGVELLVLDVHGGTTEEDILGIFEEARRIRKGEEEGSSSSSSSSLSSSVLSSESRPVFVFLDEVNTCAHMGLISEAITMFFFSFQFYLSFFHVENPFPPSSPPPGVLSMENSSMMIFISLQL